MVQKQDNNSLFTDEKICYLFLTMDINKSLATATTKAKRYRIV